MTYENMLSRRAVAGGIAAAGALAGATAAQATDAAGNMMVEWNQHMFTSDTVRYPLNPKYLAYRPSAAEQGATRGPAGGQGSAQ